MSWKPKNRDSTKPAEEVFFFFPNVLPNVAHPSGALISFRILPRSPSASPPTSPKHRRASLADDITIVGGNRTGIFVSHVRAGSPAEQCGLKEGSELLEVCAFICTYRECVFQKVLPANVFCPHCSVRTSSLRWGKCVASPVHCWSCSLFSSVVDGAFSSQTPEQPRG